MTTDNLNTHPEHEDNPVRAAHGQLPNGRNVTLGTGMKPGSASTPPHRDAVLRIRHVPGELQPMWGRDVLNERQGGPETLLAWLETQLGLPVPVGHHAARILAYAAALQEADRPEFRDSLKADRWATAAALLDRRDALWLSGWDGWAAGSSPRLLKALAEVEGRRSIPFPGEAERLRSIEQALRAGQELPPHECRLADPVAVWPAAWQRVLSRLRIVEEPSPEPSAREASTLRALQDTLLGGDPGELRSDASFHQVRTLSAGTAVECVASLLSRDARDLGRTAVLCEDDALALRLEAALHRRRVPTMGATGWSAAHPVLQVLPLTLAMCWTPVDPEAVVAFLSLPILPIPRSAARRLAKALSVEPGLGSSEWERAIAELTQAPAGSPEPDGSEAHGLAGRPLGERLREWFDGERAPRSQTISTQRLRERCGLVARWAAGRAAMLEPAADADLIAALRTVAGHASVLGELVECQGSSLSQPQLGRLLEDVLQSGIESRSHPEADGGPIRVRSLAEIGGSVDRLIWLGPVTRSPGGALWSASQCRELRAAGIEVDDGSKALAARRAAEVRGLCHVRDSLLVVIPPAAEDQRWHPAWLMVRGSLSEAERERPPILEERVVGGDAQTLGVLGIETGEFTTQLPPGPRAVWPVPAGLLAERDQVSATELENRLACPLKWVFQHQARLHPAFTAQVPDERRIRGTFAHRVLEHALGTDGPLPAVDEAVARVLSVFDERLPLDAAPLAQPERQLAASQFRRELERSTRVLVETLARGGYRIVGFELPVEGKVLGTPLTGRMDCRARNEAGAEAVIDFKYGGRKKYHEALARGTAVQLATYAHARFQVTGSQPAVAYLILSDAMLVTPQSSAVAGASARDQVVGPAIADVWEQFAKALERAGDWLTRGAPVPARPLQDTASWPDGSELVLDSELGRDKQQGVCLYCDYQRLCGLKETR